MHLKGPLAILMLCALLQYSSCQDEVEETTEAPATEETTAAAVNVIPPEEVAIDSDMDICTKYEPDGSIVETPYDSCIEYCCGGDAIKIGSDSECCGSEAFGSKYNPSTDRCCEWWTGYGKGFAQRRFRGHTTGCCGANFIYYGIQGCCYGYPDPPETFLLGREMCCGSHRVVLPTLHFLSKCCGDTAAYDITKQSCPCEDGRVLDATFDRTACCENRFGVKMPYYTLTQFCCNGFIGEKGADFCCGTSLGKLGESMCCDGELTQMSEPSTTKTACCETENYDPEKSVCCEGNVIPIAGGRDLCCGSRAYTIKAQICCEGRLSSIRKDGDTCCGRYAFFPDRGSFCCDGEVYFSDAVGAEACCGEQFYNVSDGISLCCNGELTPREGRDACCGSIPYFEDTEICCDDTSVYPKSSGTGCCMGYAYDDTDPEQICCEEGPGGPFNEPACCGGFPYSKRSGICCGDTLYTDLASPACCVDVGFDSSTHTCCGSTVYPNPLGSKTTQCCGVVDPQPFDTVNQKCCGGEIIDLPGELSRDRVECCGLSDVYDPQTQICCDGNVFAQADGNRLGCCGKESYSLSEELCCENKEYGNPFLTNFTYGRENTGCCADEVFDKTKGHCCDGFLKESEFEKSGCCAGIEYDAEKEICCEDNLVKLGNRVPANKAKCCGAKCMYDGVQFCCKDRIYMRGELSDKTCEDF